MRVQKKTSIFLQNFLKKLKKVLDGLGIQVYYNEVLSDKH